MLVAWVGCVIHHPGWTGGVLWGCAEVATEVTVMFQNSLYRLHSRSACMLANVSACLDGSQLGHPEYMGVHTVLGVCVGKNIYL